MTSQKGQPKEHYAKISDSTLRQNGHPSNSYRMMGLSGRLRNCARFPETNAPEPARTNACTEAVANCKQQHTAVMPPFMIKGHSEGILLTILT